MDYNDVIRYMMNMAKDTVKTAGNRTTNAMNKFNSLAQNNGNNVVKPSFTDSPRYKAQQIKAMQDRASSAWNTTKNVAGKTYKVLRWGGTAAAGAVGLDNYIMGNKLMQEGLRTGNRQMQQEGLDRMHKAQLTLAPLAVGGVAKGGAALTGKLAQMANAAKITPAYKTALQGAGVNEGIIGAMEAVPETISNVANTATKWLNRGGNVLTHPGTLFTAPLLVNAKNAVRNFYDDRVSSSNSNNSGNGQQPQDVTSGANGNGGGTTNQAGQPGYYNSSGSVSIGSGITPEQSKKIANIVNASSSTDDNNAGYYDPRALYQNYMIKQQAMQPYRDELNNYIRDYKRYSDWAYNQDKHLALLAALTGAQGLNQMIGKYTALGDEEKLAALKKVQGEDLKGVAEGLDTLIGNVALARKMGLPLDAVNADNKMLQLAVQKDIKDDILENKLALAQYNATVRQRLQEEKLRFQQAIKAGNRRVAQQSAMKISDYYKALQAMENYGATPEDIYRTTGRRVYVSNPQQSGQKFKDL